MLYFCSKESHLPVAYSFALLDNINLNLNYLNEIREKLNSDEAVGIAMDTTNVPGCLSANFLAHLKFASEQFTFQMVKKVGRKAPEGKFKKKKRRQV